MSMGSLEIFRFTFMRKIENYGGKVNLTLIFDLLLLRIFIVYHLHLDTREKVKDIVRIFGYLV